MVRVFMSYSHVDEALRDRLEVHLAPLKRQGVALWHDRRLLAGDALEDGIGAALAEADVVLLLVSPDFLASPACHDGEMQHAVDRHRTGRARVIPVILRACDWLSTPLRHLLAVPRDGRPVTLWPDQDQALHEVAVAIRRAVLERTPLAS
ncbi:toll/interleukin-1 receptor domain-containing protein [Nitrospirillum amazonense]|uniref:TIR domain-containing protein n=2 Tax=Nitrospirillum amazonense TaxID=28077 RepID=A0A560FXT4_9PROT|nr:toll/interleukin-1 receptor domain-containing protein [Nitrospirillum amazonense]MEC4593540.1 toll/interleukin-1 receptor domain-containing protein [Nitrospirillum amazonense]TWB26391.1 TIR domain-containing protein [Nitrospirillum amazonense]